MYKIHGVTKENYEKLQNKLIASSIISWEPGFNNLGESNLQNYSILEAMNYFKDKNKFILTIDDELELNLYPEEDFLIVEEFMKIDNKILSSKSEYRANMFFSLRDKYIMFIEKTVDGIIIHNFYNEEDEEKYEYSNLYPNNCFENNKEDLDILVGANKYYVEDEYTSVMFSFSRMLMSFPPLVKIDSKEITNEIVKRSNEAYVKDIVYAYAL